MWQTGVVPGGAMTSASSSVPEGHLVKGQDSGSHIGNTTEICKSVYDSHSDSGFLSGSNLVSSSSVDDYNNSSCNMPTNSTISSALDNSSSAITGRGGGGSDAVHSSTVLTSSGCLDSGIDISEQLSSLQLRSPEASSVSCDDVGSVSERETSSRGEDDASNRLEISRSHVTLLREIFSPDKDGDTQLHVAVMRGFIEVVYHITRLLPHQAFLDLCNNAGKTALHLAVSARVPAVARHLIVCGASPVSRDLRGNTPLHVACARKDPEMVSHLTRPVTVTEVMNAQLAYAPSHTPGLLAADLTNFQGETCVHVAAMAGDKEILQHLTWYGADVNAKERRSGRTALHFAVEARDPELVAHIVNTCRASVTVETYSRLSPYQLALANGATGIATQLLDLGAPAQLLPAAFTQDDDDEDDDDDDDLEDQLEYSQVSDSVSGMSGWQEVDDIRLSGVPVRSSMSSQTIGPPPVSTAPHTINADLFF
uniref:NF-kappa-B inhibitor cactus-like n=1 Tax=Hirondellea gigas TaxID=1518452 RepID=A0A2P2HZ17_9CRUS